MHACMIPQKKVHKSIRDFLFNKVLQYFHQGLQEQVISFLCIQSSDEAWVGR